MLETENSKITRQECEQQYLCIFKTGSSNKSTSRAQSYRLMQPNKSEVSMYYCNSSAAN